MRSGKSIHAPYIVKEVEEATPRILWTWAFCQTGRLWKSEARDYFPPSMWITNFAFHTLIYATRVELVFFC